MQHFSLSVITLGNGYRSIMHDMFRIQCCVCQVTGTVMVM